MPSFFLSFLFVQARTYLDPAEIFKAEAEEAYEKTQKAIAICMCFKENFEDIRRNIQKFFKEGQEAKQWEFANELVFTRIDLFIQRLKIVEVSFSEAESGSSRSCNSVGDGVSLSSLCSVILQTPPLPLTFFVPYNSFLLISTL